MMLEANSEEEHSTQSRPGSARQTKKCGKNTKMHEKDKMRPGYSRQDKDRERQESGLHRDRRGARSRRRKAPRKSK